ncbi:MULTISPECIES: PHP domain-containing protein [Romboutsia]|jgi:putative hydrolase|uniref:PHP domain protein n=1 Tax=Romboutsia ilealis TaxID=1115758 RepID=A0A1V1HYA0_9FIRM|nr:MULTISPECIES: PHP domain-containing protein [Romboutsia]MCI9061848.1 PHP domain-containing protein [Romboutsia sp.]MCI9259612.1 PHP domain-containing protein [Romboutsia sp.]CED92857.1 PHP domain protein [Romboutsia ilealis]
MQILADYHTHTKYSHGKGTIEENVLEAISKGIKIIGISDHGYKHLAYGIKLNDIYKMREEIDKLNEKYSNIEILLGMECNILDSYGNIDINDKIIENCDYIMAGYHFASTPTSLKSMLNHCNNYIIKNEMAKDYNTNAIINAMKNNDIFIITHPGDKGDVYIEEIAKVAKNTDTRLEINSSHGFLNSNQLVKIKGIGNKFIIGSDAHVPHNVGNFDLAMKIIKEAGVDLSLIENIKI